jgi:hypothetical protein
MLMLFVDNFNDHGMGSGWPKIDHSPWDGVHLADFVMPLFLFMVRAAAAACWLPLPLSLPPPQLPPQLLPPPRPPPRLPMGQSRAAMCCCTSLPTLARSSCNEWSASPGFIDLLSPCACTPSLT